MKSWHKRNLLFYGEKKFLMKERELPESVTRWLGKLNLLQGVPFQYLISDNKLLPQESLRFFYIDEVWMANLIDGALSIGRNHSRDGEHDSAFYKSINRQVKSATEQIRGAEIKKQSQKNYDGNIRTGVLLRSKIVEAWPGLEMKAFGDEETGQSLPILRMERLANDVIICIFSGVIETLEVKEPAETMHFGADFEAGKFQKMLRGLGVGKIPLGVEMEDVVVEVPLKNRENRTVDVLKVVEDMRVKLKEKGEFDMYLSSAEFAVQMIESAQMGVFKNGKKQ